MLMVFDDMIVDMETNSLFHDQFYFSVIVIHVQLCKHSWYKKQPEKRRLVELI